ncbi:MAG: hypothetical protein NZ805_05320 [Armatimonadetes bacterium]|nr:hypothetical protein [Armatimonadota bacterium]MDW8028020.1 DNA gyrase C-terminal beta-propeller domain-containing protein [Armatimonadota bacterium]
MPARYLLLVTQDGYAKRTPITDFRSRRRGCKGANALKEGFLLGGVAIVSDNGEILVITERGRVLRTPINEIAILSRTGRGGKIIQLDEGDKVIAVLPI